MPTLQTEDAARAKQLGLRLLLLYPTAATLSMALFVLWTTRNAPFDANMLRIIWAAPLGGVMYSLPFLPIFLLGWTLLWLLGRKLGLAIPTRATLSALGATLTPIVLYRLHLDRIPGQDWLYDRIIDPVTVIVPLVTTLLAALLFRRV